MRALRLLLVLGAGCAWATNYVAVTGNNTGDVTMAAVGSSPNANGASIANGPPNQTLTLQPADGTHPGLVTSGAQTLGGNKTLTGQLILSGSTAPELSTSNTSANFQLQSGINAGSAALGAFQLKSANALSGSDLLLVMMNAGSNVWQMDYLGNVVTNGNYDTFSTVTPQYNCLGAGAACVFQSGTAEPVELVSGQSSGSASAGAVQLNSKNTLSGGSDLLVTMNNNGTTEFQVDKSGNATATGVVASATTTQPQFQCTASASCQMQSKNGQFMLVDTGGGSTLALGANNAATLTVGNSTASLVQVVSEPATSNKGFRNQSSRTTTGTKSVGVIDCAAANLTPSVTQILDGSFFTCATAQTLTMPTAQGASGLVQNLPGQAVVGDVFQFKMAENHATNTFTLLAGAGGTIYGIATITNGARIWECRVTSTTLNSETITCY